jgi:hypothetical protein
LKLLNNFENAYPPQNSLLCDWLMFSSADSHWLQGKCTRIILSLAASDMILQNHRRLPVCIFQRQNRGFMVFEAGYWKDFKN